MALRDGDDRAELALEAGGADEALVHQVVLEEERVRGGEERAAAFEHVDGCRVADRDLVRDEQALAAHVVERGLVELLVAHVPRVAIGLPHGDHAVR